MPTLLADPAVDSSTNPDLSLLFQVNGLAKAAPGWVDSSVSWIGEYGILIGLAMLCVVGWLQARKRPDAPAAVAGLLWAPLAAAVAEVANLPISTLVHRPRPFVDHAGLKVLVSGKEGTLSFVSDHSTMAMAFAVALLLVSRKLGLIAGALALLQGFCRMFMGVHYPTDVLGGYALGAAVVLLLAPLAMAALVPLCHALTRGFAAPLVVAAPRRSSSSSRRRGPAPARLSGEAEETAPYRPERPASDLAA